MFTGIVQTFGKIIDVVNDKSNVHFTIESNLSKQLKIDQSVAHNGVCLTVVKQNKQSHTVTAIKETIDKTTLGTWEKGDKINLELAMQANAFLDGHIVQGHVDQVAICKKIELQEGSTMFYFKFIEKPKYALVDKGSVCVDGTSLTVVKAKKKLFSVAIIPYTLEHTLFHQYQVGSIVNIEFDIFGKYVENFLKQSKKSKK
ncbi:MAG: riboflavin synthase [Sphingobacteriales bacterium]|jgi:riboflavin synthase|nr:MAG: riboflavin synthase [Sphingobacteriales bacterium]